MAQVVVTTVGAVLKVLKELEVLLVLDGDDCMVRLMEVDLVLRRLELLCLHLLSTTWVTNLEL